MKRAPKCSKCGTDDKSRFVPSAPTVCRECRREAGRRWAKANPGKSNEYGKAWRLANPERAKANQAKAMAKSRAKWIAPEKCSNNACVEPDPQFYRLNAVCKKCVGEKQKLYSKANRKTITARNKKWRLANQGKSRKYSLDWYYRNGGHRPPETEEGREKQHENGRAYRKAHPMAHVYPMRKYKYGLSKERLDAMFAEQGARCAICPAEISINAAHVDHDHKTKRVRGLLCRRCNQGLGFFRDSPELIRYVLEYLAEHHPQVALA